MAYATRVHAVDGTYELYRAHYSKRPRKVATVDGEELAALDDASFVGAILALVDSVASDAPLAYEVDR